MKVSVGGQLVWRKEVQVNDYTPVDIYGNNKSFFTTSYNNSRTTSITKWNFDSTNIWTTLQEDLRVSTLWANNENLYLIGYVKTGDGLLEYELSLTKMDLEGNTYWNKRKLPPSGSMYLVGASSFYLIGDNASIYTFSPWSTIRWKFSEESDFFIIGSQDSTILLLLGIIGASVLQLSIVAYHIKVKNKYN